MTRTLLFVALLGCGPDSVGRPPAAPYDRGSLEPRPMSVDVAPPSVTQKEHDIADKYLAALAAPDSAALGPVLADDVHFTLAGLVTTDAIGRRDVIAAHDKLFGPFDRKRFAPGRVLLTSDAQSIEWTLTARDKATGAPIGIRGIALVTTSDNGTIRDIHLCFDQGILLAQVSGAPKQLAALPRATPPGRTRVEAEWTNSPEETANGKLAASSVEALQNDETAYVAAFTDDVEIDTGHSARPIKGKLELHSYYQALHAAIAGIATTVDNRWGIAEYTVVEYHLVGRQRTRYEYVPIKDPVIKLYFAEVAELRDGKIAHVWRYDNPIQILQQ